MGKPCVVPKCRTGSERSKHSMFRVPKDTELLKKWENAIPGNVKLRPLQFVCDKHFKNEYILREWIKRDANDKIIARAAYKRPQLSKGAVPTIFGKDAEEKAAAESNFLASVGANLEITTSSVLNSNNELPVSPMECEETNPVVKCNSSAKSTAPLIEKSNKDDLNTKTALIDHSYQCINDITSDKSPQVENSQKSIPKEVPKVTKIDLTVSRVPKKQYSFVSTFTINQHIQKENKSVATCQQFSATVPISWGVSEIATEKGPRILFSYAVTKTENDIRVPVTQKCVLLDPDRTLNYFVWGRRVKTEETTLVPTLQDAASLPSTLILFQRMGICNGSGIDYTNYAVENTFLDNIRQWRHDDCTLISKKKRCEFCTRLRNRIKQRITSIKTRPSLKRIHRKTLNAFDQRKISELLKRNARERSNALKAKARANVLTRVLQEQEEKISRIEDDAFEKSCAEMQIPQTQKLALKEMISAASTTNVKGRRYTQEWMMLCMLMNMRSKEFYEVLRSNNVLPLPCTRTIRRYFSQVELKCGFDEQFGELLKKHFANKSPQQCHGVLLLDEINLQKSAADSSKNLTCVDLTNDVGEDESQSRDPNDKATHSLVLIFQPLADSYVQPIAFFASKDPLNGEDLAKLTVKGIAYLENCGAKIHGVIADGAATNSNMWPLLGVNALMENTKTWFTHPLDDERKVFVFSDVPHLINNIRNRLHDQEKLRLKQTQQYIRWKYFVDLHNLDKIHPANIRKCPQITTKHVVLDSESKTRVRLATEIFSKSVAEGLKFYLSKDPEKLNGCEETIAFCKRISDIFDALNQKSPDKGLVPDSSDFKVLEDSLHWLNEWELAEKTNDITSDEFITAETSRGLRISLTSTMQMCRYLVDNFDFQCLLTGKVNRDNIEGPDPDL